MFLTLPRGDSYATVAELCIALDETSIFVQRLTDRTKREDFKLDSLSLPDDTGHWQFYGWYSDSSYRYRGESEENQRKSSVDFQEFASFNASDGGLLLCQRP